VAPDESAGITVIAAALIEKGRLLVVSKTAAPSVFYLPGGKPEPGEDPERTLVRELDEELGVTPADAKLLGDFVAVAAIEAVPLRMTVYSARLDGTPRPRAELASIGWTNGRDQHDLAPAVRDLVLPYLRHAGLMRGWRAPRSFRRDVHGKASLG
jgi:8-oxo-dGTP pyrophosphatase MutT (NUDIX family)